MYDKDHNDHEQRYEIALNYADSQLDQIRTEWSNKLFLKVSERKGF